VLLAQLPKSGMGRCVGADVILPGVQLFLFAMTVPETTQTNFGKFGSKNYYAVFGHIFKRLFFL
jgi:hypothetical protein